VIDLYRERNECPSDIQAHLPRLYSEVLRIPNATVVELGVRSGFSTVALLAAVEQVEGHLWSVDIGWPTLPAEVGVHPRFTFILGNDLEVADRLPDRIDVLFVDTSHTYDQTLAELDLYMPRVTGVALFHDTELPSAPDGTPGPEYPVDAALTDWCATQGRMWEQITGCWGLGVIDV
jgi:predicted O-methyltransferase YrrM